MEKKIPCDDVILTRKIIDLVHNSVGLDTRLKMYRYSLEMGEYCLRRMQHRSKFLDSVFALYNNLPDRQRREVQGVWYYHKLGGRNGRELSTPV